MYIKVWIVGIDGVSRIIFASLALEGLDLVLVSVSKATYLGHSLCLESLNIAKKWLGKI